MKIFNASAAKTRILVWHAPVPGFHWLLALSFVGAYVTAETDPRPAVHATLGYTMAGLVALGFWWLQWQNPSTLASGGRGLTSQDAKHRPHTQDDD